MADAECDMDTGTGISPPLVGSGSESLDGNSDLLPVPDHEHVCRYYVCTRTVRVIVCACANVMW